ncbi:MAG: UDP-N-acetylglucosamine 2-epimerase, partial [Desulfobacteraceae bacterium]|nr:UDP-N-acetylglucosamine 2-epimerase [Desulfobacteraceae bacterium]
MKIAVVVGTRPEFIKTWSVIEEAKNRKEVQHLLIHTGQHYDYEMFQLFIDKFGIPEPRNLNIDVTRSVVAEIIYDLNAVFETNRPDLVIVPGDTDSALGAGLA